MNNKIFKTRISNNVNHCDIMPSQYIIQVCAIFVCVLYVCVRLEPIMLKNLPIIPSRTSLILFP